MKDNKDNATLELPGFDTPILQSQEARRAAAQPRRNKMGKQVQLELLQVLGPTDVSGLPAWIKDENTDLSGLPVWR